MADVDRLQAVGQSLASVADRLSASFARELARVLTLAERALLPVLREALAGRPTARVRAGRALTLRRELRTVLRQAGYDRLVAEASVEGVAQMADALRTSGAVRQVGRLGAITPARLDALARLMRVDLLGLGDTAAHQLWRAAAQALFSARPAETLVAQLARQLGRSLQQTQTLYDTQVSIAGRQIEQVVTEGEDAQAFLYVGPVDARTRDWCLDRVGQVYTRAAIERLDNGQLPNAFLTGGGYNCRHTFLAVADPVLVRLADTGQRAEGYDGRVAMARALRTQRARFRELRRAA